MEEKLDDRGSFVSEHLLKTSNVIISFVPAFFREDVADANRNDVFVVAAVEDDGLAVLRDLAVDAPEIVVGKFQLAGSLEGGNPNALGIHLLKNAADRAVFSAGIHCLENDEKAMFALRIKLLLEDVDLVVKLLEEILALELGDREHFFVSGRKTGQVHFLSGSDSPSGQSATFFV